MKVSGKTPVEPFRVNGVHKWADLSIYHNEPMDSMRMWLYSVSKLQKTISSFHDESISTATSSLQTSIPYSSLLKDLRNLKLLYTQD